MSTPTPLITIGFDKYGDADFGILGTVGALSLDQMNKIRQMIPVAIGQAEDMFRRNQENINCASREISNGE